MSESLSVRYVLAFLVQLEAYICRTQLEAYICRNGKLMLPMTVRVFPATLRLVSASLFLGLVEMSQDEEKAKLTQSDYVQLNTYH